jgi:hypothetical protein
MVQAQRLKLRIRQLDGKPQAARVPARGGPAPEAASTDSAARDEPDKRRKDSRARLFLACIRGVSPKAPLPPLYSRVRATPASRL